MKAVIFLGLVKQVSSGQYLKIIFSSPGRLPNSRQMTRKTSLRARYLQSGIVVPWCCCKVQMASKPTAERRVRVPVYCNNEQSSINQQHAIIINNLHLDLQHLGMSHVVKYTPTPGKRVSERSPRPTISLVISTD